jgi:hypothetical protein
MTSGIRPGWLTRARAESWPGARTSWIIAGSSPAASSAGPMTASASATAERIAADPVRSTPALRDLTNCEAMSTTTFGRASKLAPITPTGLRHSSRRSPPGSFRIVRRDGSAGISASARSWPAIESRRVSSSRRRSSSASRTPSASAARTSCSFASSTGALWRPSRSAMPRSASSRMPSATTASPGTVSRAARPASSTALAASSSVVMPAVMRVSLAGWGLRAGWRRRIAAAFPPTHNTARSDCSVRIWPGPGCGW